VNDYDKKTISASEAGDAGDAARFFLEQTLANLGKVEQLGKIKILHPKKH